MLSKDELERYDRQIMIEGFGREGQEKLKRAKVVIAVVGGLVLLQLSTWQPPGLERYE